MLYWKFILEKWWLRATKRSPCHCLQAADVLEIPYGWKYCWTNISKSVRPSVPCCLLISQNVLWIKDKSWQGEPQATEYKSLTVIGHYFHPSFLVHFNPTSSPSLTDTHFFAYVYPSYASSHSWQNDKDTIQLVVVHRTIYCHCFYCLVMILDLTHLFWTFFNFYSSFKIGHDLPCSHDLCLFFSIC